MRNALSILFFVTALVFTGCGGGGDASSSLRIPIVGTGGLPRAYGIGLK